MRFILGFMIGFIVGAVATLALTQPGPDDFASG
jgi:gas vesicle protein